MSTVEQWKYLISFCLSWSIFIYKIVWARRLQETGWQHPSLREALSWYICRYTEMTWMQLRWGTCHIVRRGKTWRLRISEYENLWKNRKKMKETWKSWQGRHSQRYPHFRRLNRLTWPIESCNISTGSSKFITIISTYFNTSAFRITCDEQEKSCSVRSWQSLARSWSRYAIRTPHHKYHNPTLCSEALGSKGCGSVAQNGPDIQCAKSANMCRWYVDMNFQNIFILTSIMKWLWLWYLFLPAPVLHQVQVLMERAFLGLQLKRV